VLLAKEDYERMQARLAGEGTAPAPTVTGVPPGILASQEAYWRDLPQLLKLKSPQRPWGAYHREQRGGVARPAEDLYQECERRGIPTSEFYVDRLEPRAFAPWEVEVIGNWFEPEEPPPSAS